MCIHFMWAFYVAEPKALTSIYRQLREYDKKKSTVLWNTIIEETIYNLLAGVYPLREKLKI